MTTTLATAIKKYSVSIVVVALVFAVLGGFLLRLWRLDSAPKGALIDELHFGYIAHSLITTGADEHGERWPITFRAFGDEKLPAMAYADIPAVLLFGLSIFAIRIPSVIAGTLLILVVYWLARELRLRRSLALLGAFLTAVSPWTFFLSRFGFESNLALLFFTTGLAALMRALNSSTQKWWYMLAGALFGLSWYSYIAYRPITVGLFVCLYSFLFFKKQLTKSSLLGLGVLILVVLPLLQPNEIGVNNTRFDQVGILSNPSTSAIVIEKRNFCIENLPQLLCYGAFNKPLYFLRETTRRYLNSFSPDFLVGRGEVDNDFLTVDGFAQFFPIFYPVFLLGLGGLVLLKQEKKDAVRNFLIVAGLLLAPIPSALVGDPQKVRISAFFPFVLLAILYGIRYLTAVLPKIYYPWILLTILLASAGYSGVYLSEYFGVHATQHEYKYQSYAPKLSEYLLTLSPDTLVNIKPFYSDPLMFHAFYSKIDPVYYQKNAVLGELEPGGFQHTVELGSIKAEKTNIVAFGCTAKELGKPAIFVTDEDIPHAKVLFSVKATNGVHTYLHAYDAGLFVKDLYCDQQ